MDHRFPAGPVTTALDWGRNPDERLEPGSPGYWRVYGARADDIRPGDLVMSGWADDDGIKRHAEYDVVDLAPWGDLRDSLRVRFLTTTGQHASVGRMQPMALLRQGTHGTLADSVR